MSLTPEADLRAAVSVASVYVLVDEGVIPAFASQVYVGRLWFGLFLILPDSDFGGKANSP
jgi:hypothetical protein